MAAVAQLVEHVIRNDGVGGSSPFSGTNKIFFIIAIQRVKRRLRNPIPLSAPFYPFALPDLGLVATKSANIRRLELSQSSKPEMALSTMSISFTTS